MQLIFWNMVPERYARTAIFILKINMGFQITGTQLIHVQVTHLSLQLCLDRFTQMGLST